MDKAELLRRRLDGLTYAQIGLEAGISRQRVQKLLQPPPLVRLALSDKYEDKCADCGIDLQYRGHAHHVGANDGVEDYNDLPNLVLLCISCHRLAHNNDQRHGLLCCLRCEHRWPQRGPSKPRWCAKCRSPYWDRPRFKPKYVKAQGTIKPTRKGEGTTPTA